MSTEALPLCIVTGANTGIGRVTAEVLAKQGYRVVLTCRSKDKAQPVLDAIARDVGPDRAEFLKLELSSLKSVRTAAETFLKRNEPLPLLINNAGLAGHKGLTEDGFELSFGVNHIGHFLFTTMLLDRIKAAPNARIVTVSSKAHYKADRIDWDAVREPRKTISGMREYSVSKLANVLFSNELGRRLEGSGVRTYSLHPGVVASDVWRRIPWPFRGLVTRRMLTVEQGAKTTLYCATSDAVAEHTGRYYDNEKEVDPNSLALDVRLAKELWDRSEAWVKPYAAAA